MPGYPVAAVIPALLLLVSGCVSQAPNTAAPANASHVELISTPFHPQTQYHCGPSALATVLGSSGLKISPERMSREVYLPGRKGTLQLEIIAAVRRHGRIPYQLDGNLQAILGQLDADLPVLVLLNQGIGMFPAWHYATVIGYQPGTDSVILRSGSDFRLEMSRRRFENDWKKAGYWSLVVLQPGQFPASVDMDRYLDALIAMEEAGQWKAVETGYQAVLSHSPEDSPVNRLARFGLANALRADNQLEAAVMEYKQLLSRDPGHLSARNNLADTLLALGRCNEATETIDRIDPDPAIEPAISAAIHATRAEIYATCIGVRP